MPSNTLGEKIAISPQLSRSGSGSAMVFGEALASKGRISAGPSDLQMSAGWTRGFSLAAGEVFMDKTLCSL